MSTTLSIKVKLPLDPITEAYIIASQVCCREWVSFEISSLSTIWLAREEGVDGSIELVAAFEEVEFKYENVPQEYSTESLN